MCLEFIFGPVAIPIYYILIKQFFVLCVLSVLSVLSVLNVLSVLSVVSVLSVLSA